MLSVRLGLQFRKLLKNTEFPANFDGSSSAGYGRAPKKLVPGPHVLQKLLEAIATEPNTLIDDFNVARQEEGKFCADHRWDFRKSSAGFTQ